MYWTSLLPSMVLFSWDIRSIFGSCYLICKLYEWFLDEFKHWHVKNSMGWEQSHKSNRIERRIAWIHSFTFIQSLLGKVHAIDYELVWLRVFFFFVIHISCNKTSIHQLENDQLKRHEKKNDWKKEKQIILAKIFYFDLFDDLSILIPVLRIMALFNYTLHILYHSSSCWTYKSTIDIIMEPNPKWLEIIGTICYGIHS